jgi:hypothetical protein
MGPEEAAEFQRQMFAAIEAHRNNAGAELPVGDG